MPANDDEAQKTKTGAKSKPGPPHAAPTTQPGEKANHTFRAAMQDVRPLTDQERFAPQPTLKNVNHMIETPAAGSIFEVHRDGEQHWGQRTGLAPKTLSRLRRGQIAIERELDLHQLTEDEARTRVLACLRTTRDSEARCVRIIHGRGLHSAGAPVLKTSLVDWLETDPAFAKLRREILAFTTAPPALGGSGATLILFARKR